MKKTPYVFLLFCLPVLMLRVCAADGDADAHKKRFLLTGMKDNMNRLQQGVFRATGRLSNHDPPTEDFECEVNLFSAFDYANDWFRFDRSESMRMLDDPSSKKWRLERVGGKYARTREASVQWHIGTKIAGIRAASAFKNAIQVNEPCQRSVPSPQLPDSETPSERDSRMGIMDSHPPPRHRPYGDRRVYRGFPT